MAKGAKQSFKDTVADFERIRSDIAARRFAPIYLFMGEEPYFIDFLSSLLAESILSEAERSFNQTMLYGRDSDVGSVINLCRQMPMMGAYQVVIIREAQQMKRLEEFSLYIKTPSSSTIVILCHKEKNLDKRSQLYKSIESRGCIFESVRPRDYEINSWLTSYIRSKGCSIEHGAQEVLVSNLGADISKISNELGKLMLYLPEGTKHITADHIEQNIGINKEFNNYELTKALSERDMIKALRIANHFAHNPKDNPLLVTVSTIFSHFQRIFTLNYIHWTAKHRGEPIPQDMDLSRILKLPNPFFLGEYKQAAALYPNKKVFAILGLLRDYDLKSKGMGAGSASEGELLRELLLKIFMQ